MVRSIQRVPLDVRWNAGRLGEVASSRHDLHVSPAIQRRLVPDPDLGDLARGRLEVLKGMPLRKSDFVKFGYTENCPRCEDSELLGWGRTSKAHSSACRERLGADLQKIPDGRRRMDSHANPCVCGRQESVAVRLTAAPCMRCYAPATSCPIQTTHCLRTWGSALCSRTSRNRPSAAACL